MRHAEGIPSSPACSLMQDLLFECWEMLQQHGELYPGLSVLRCAIDILNAHYPELLYKVHGWTPLVDV